MRKGLVRILMAVTIQQRNQYSLVQYRSARCDAMSRPAALAHMPNPLAVMEHDPMGD